MTAVLVTLLVVVVAILVVLVVGVLRVRALRTDAAPKVLIFLTSTCTTCASLWGALETWGTATLGDARVVIVTKSKRAERPDRIRELSPPAIPVVMSTQAWSAYGVEQAPYFAYVDRGNVLVEGDAPTWDVVVAACTEGAGEA